jgi:hypothetical protein
MQLGTYIASGLVLIAFIAGGVYMLYPDYHSLTLMGFTIDLPIAVWIALPVLLLYLMSILHMAYYGGKLYFQRRRWRKDIDSFKDALYWAILKEPKSHNYSVAQIKEGASLLNVAHIDVVGNVQGLSDRLADALETAKEIESGKYVDLREKKLDGRLSKSNPLLVKNQLNRLEEKESFAEDILFNSAAYDEKVVEKAMEIVISRNDLYKVKKYSSLLKKSHFDALMEQISQKETVGATIEMLEFFISSFDMGCKEYMKVARIVLKKFTPDENLALFKRLMQKSDAAQNAYLYLLFEYEMLENVKQFFEENDEYEFKVFRAVFILKRNKYNFKIDDLLDCETACR